MNQRTFFIILFVLAALLTGWLVYATRQGAQAEPIQEVTTKYWQSGHANAEATAFNHWNEDGEVPAYCAKCHSSSGFRDFIGADGTEAGSNENPGRIQDPISCLACHNDQAHALDAVTFPNGVEITGTGNASACMTCHGGMGSSKNVDKAIEGKDLEEIMEGQGLLAAHYHIAAAMNMGSEAGMGYQYEGKSYVGKFHHADLVDSCTKCHDPHSLRTKKGDNDKTLCNTCHSEVQSFPDYRKVTTSKKDWDGDGTVESAYDEVEGVKAVLWQAMHQYALNTTGNALAFKTEQYPYVFIDTNADGVLDESEANFGNQFKSFTPRLLRAAYNYMFVVKDAAAYLHNAEYALQLMYDAIEDLAGESGVSVDALIRP